MLDKYRGISLIDIPCKVFSLIIQKRLAAWIDSQLLEQQCGFRAGRSCNDAIFSMRLLQEHAIRNKQPMLAAFVDLSKAYDSVDRELAWQCFRHRGMSEKLLKMLQLLHSSCSCEGGSCVNEQLVMKFAQASNKGMSMPQCCSIYFWTQC